MLKRLSTPIIFSISAALLLCAVFRAYAQPGDAALPLSEYKILMEDILAGIQAAGEYSDDQQIEIFREYADQLSEIGSIELDPGTTLPIDHSYFVSNLQPEFLDLAQLEAVFSNYIALLKTWNAADFDEGDLALLSQILGKPEYQWASHEASKIELWLDNMVEKFLEFLQKYLSIERDISGAAAVNLNLLLTILGSVVLVLALWFVFRDIRNFFVPEADTIGDGGMDEHILTADSAMQKANRMSRGGDYRSAVRFLYLSLLLGLEDRGVLRYDRSKTNREYLSVVRGNPEIVDTLAEIIDVFDRVWYGFQDLPEAEFNLYASRVAELNRFRT